MQPEKASLLDCVDEETLSSYKDPQAGSSSLKSVSGILPDVRPTNFIQLSRDIKTLRGAWIIDPAMVVPSPFLPSLRVNETEETRSNISLDVSLWGAIHADIFLLSTKKDSTSATAQRQKIYIQGHSSGTLTMKLILICPVQHEAFRDRAAETRWPMRISCSSVVGNVNIYLPRSFRGLIDTEVTLGSVRFSDAMKGLMTQFAHKNGVQRHFLGDFDANAVQSAGEWVGDRLRAEAMTGSVRIFFNDEDVPPDEAEDKVFMRSRWFWFSVLICIFSVSLTVVFAM
ncbi:hypothetical protein CVT25_004283 [Psilocybe cyanescens]|uniref:DUF7330 domain-containing protein n=1 Tax=Psilocybe cyanescens TaxID=93625 RepID=A0A409WXH7_PSICY|nr:hypothetical protein CVT25_004283 [Psilocybe cyanescens]